MIFLSRRPGIMTAADATIFGRIGDGPGPVDPRNQSTPTALGRSLLRLAPILAGDNATTLILLPCPLLHSPLAPLAARLPSSPPLPRPLPSHPSPGAGSSKYTALFNPLVPSKVLLGLTMRMPMLPHRSSAGYLTPGPREESDRDPPVAKRCGNGFPPLPRQPRRMIGGSTGLWKEYGWTGDSWSRCSGSSVEAGEPEEASHRSMALA